jgi:hemerythrin-like domain-containing protein
MRRRDRFARERERATPPKPSRVDFSQGARRADGRYFGADRAPSLTRGNTKEPIMRPTEILSAEHRVIEQVLDCLEKIADKAAACDKLEMDSARTVLRVLRTFADRCHHGKEEKQLFPMLERRGMPTHVGPVAVMLDEHEIGRAEIRKMDAALSDGEREGARAFCDAARSYVELLRDHIAKEDNILFPMAESVLRDEDRAELLASFENVEHGELGSGTHEEMLSLANALADRFGVKRAAERSATVLAGCCHGHGHAAKASACTPH